MKFTCLIPTYNNGAMIGAAIESILAQTHANFELFIVCDGAPTITHEIADRFARGDSRVRTFKFAKGERHGEASRHRALQEATGDAVCYLSDDDCWFPDHLQIMMDLLASADFAHTRHTFLKPTYEFSSILTQLVDPATRERMCSEKFNIMGPSVVGHLTSAYRRLPEPWAPAPAAVPTDLHMWRKWIRAPKVRFASSKAITTLHIPRSVRAEQDYDTGLRETNFWRINFRDPAMRAALRELMSGETTDMPAGRVALRANEIRRTQASETRS
ncbi:MAG: glycosyltransferase family 2 protein [Hyphomonadaceae bacterium]